MTHILKPSLRVDWMNQDEQFPLRDENGKKIPISLNTYVCAIFKSIESLEMDPEMK